jgi:ligand-binding sensor domain-containing protein/signal transduction histidine kinase/DNA-binding response OmpR family regulator
MRAIRILIVLFFSLFFIQGNFAQAPSYVFHQLSIKDGLSEGTVRAIVEDKRGFMWFGTEDGLNKYDGYRFTIYKSNPQDSFSITSNNTKCFYNAPNGDLWIGTRLGVNIYDHLGERFYNSRSSKYPFLKHIQGDIEAIFHDKKGVLWVLTSTHGLYKIISTSALPEQFQYPIHKDNQFVSIAIDQDDNFLIGTYNGLLKFNTHSQQFENVSARYGEGYQVRGIYIDKENTIWMATIEGLKKIEGRTGELISYKHDPANKNSIQGTNAIRVIPDGENLLIAIDGSGIDQFNPKTEQFTHYNKESGSQLSSNNTTAIYKDSKNNLWSGTFLNGINISNSATNLFVAVKNNTTPSESVRNGVVTSFLRDSKGNFWIATDGGGLNLRKKGADRFINYDGLHNKKVIASPAPVGLMESSEGDIWVSTYAGGASRIRPNGEVTIFHHHGQDPHSLAWDKNKALCEYQNEIWISTHGRGLSVYNKQTNSFRQYRSHPNQKGSLPSDWTYQIVKDSRNTLWLATFQGLAKYLPEQDAFKTYLFHADGVAVDQDYIFDIFEDSQQHLWLGTNGGGLVLFDRDTEKFISYTTNDGLSDNSVKNVIEDNKGDLWLATNNGVTKFDLPSRKAVSYKINDGLPAGSFYYNSKYKDERGRILFGMNDGYLVIDPSLSTEKVEYPTVVLTEFRLFNVPVSPRTPSSPLKKQISEASEVTLNYNQNSISFEFAALNFSIPRHNYYAYQLEGFDKDWIYAGKERKATYTNLNPGTYVLKVKASNSEKEWGTAASQFTILIAPPFWATWWFRMLAILLLAASLVGFFYFRTRAIRQRNKWLEDEVNERTYELKEANKLIGIEKDYVVEQSEKILVQQKELLDKKYELEKSNEQLTDWSQFQNRLIGILSHDIRGPLQNFSLLLQLQDEQSADWIKKTLKETADSMSLLATDLLSWANLQSQKGALEYSEFSWPDVIEKAKAQLKTVCEARNITFSLRNKEKQVIKGVPPIVLSCLRNILSNSIRYSEIGGVIEIETGTKGEMSFLRITDFGKGFDAIQINKLIQGEAFTGLKDSNLKESAGLGMAICYDMMKRTGGQIEAASLPGSGATFYLYLPIVSVQGETTPPKEKEELPLSTYKTEYLKGKSILLVDDDDQIRWNTAKLLSHYVEIKEVRSAEEALEWLQEHTPDMALLDVHMKGMSGIELCRQIKQSPKTAHVPCTVISGDDSEETRKEVLQVGADGFITKPFKTDDLLAHVCNYFENQTKKMRRFFQEELTVTQLAQNPINQQFLAEILKIVEENLNSEDLNVDFLARETGLSRSSFYRKLRSLTGQSANDFIVNVRMRKALALLKDQRLNISEIAARTGFFSPSYFTTTFKKHFGYSPTDLKKNQGVS